MSDLAADFWTDETSVVLKSFWGWTPETWGKVGWTGPQGLARRNNLLNEVSNPFTVVCYITVTAPNAAFALRGKIAGFYQVSHETGDRDEFTHPIHHSNTPDQWRHSLRAIRAFSYLPEHLLKVSDLDPSIQDRAQSMAKYGKVINDSKQIMLLRETPWVEVDVYTPAIHLVNGANVLPGQGLVRAGPLNPGGYMVESTNHANWQLYVLRMEGDTQAYMGKTADSKAIFKIGLSVSPDLRRQAFEKSMPRGTFRWIIDRTSSNTGLKGNLSFEAAVAGEDAMKRHLAACAEWLGGEFYLATEDQIEKAWKLGLTKSKSKLKPSKKSAARRKTKKKADR